MIGYYGTLSGGIYNPSTRILLHVHFLDLYQCSSIVADMNDHGAFLFRDPFSDGPATSLRSSLSGPSSIRRSNSTLDRISTSRQPHGINPLRPKHVFKSYLLSEEYVQNSQ